MDETKSVIETSREHAATAAARGAALLDERIPNWVEQIDLLDLDVSSVGVCVLGQVFGGYTSGMIDLFGSVSDYSAAVNHGFEQRGLIHETSLYPSEEYDLLTNAWAEEIVERQVAASATV